MRRVHDPERWSSEHVSHSSNAILHEPSLFGIEVAALLPPQSHVLDLAAGQGRDTRLFVDEGHVVTSLDFSEAALDLCASRLMSAERERVTFVLHGLQDPLPFDDGVFDAVYSHLGLHYFDIETTQRIFGDINRVLRPNGLFATMVNSVHDIEYGNGTFVDDFFYELEPGIWKRYFSVEHMRSLTNGLFEPMLLDDEGASIKPEKGEEHNFVRFVGRKI